MHSATSTHGRKSRRKRRLAAGAAAPVALLVLAAGAFGALQHLPNNGAQVNNDPANSIDPNQDAGVSDVVGGAVTAGAAAVPWATFEQKTGSAQQIFVRAFKNGKWVTQGFPASLNIDPTVEAEAPSIDFAGPGRATPWVAWYEPNEHLSGNKTNIFASRFQSATNLWLPSGQDRSAGFSVPALNIHTNRTAENPSLAGGTTTPGGTPGPWVTWEENDGGNTDGTSKRQIFVSRAIGGQANCNGITPAGNPPVNGFCWQQTGLQRLSPTSLTSSATGDPTLNVDPTRTGIEPDIAFTGPSDTVPWVVWYERGNTGLNGLRQNEQVFAAKAVADATAGAGGFHYQAVGNGTTGQVNVLDRSGANQFGACSASRAAEDACSLNKAPGVNAEDPRVAAGTLTPGGTTVPWVVWAEDVGGGKHAIFVSRLVGGDHFELFNSGQPVSNTVNDSSRPDITFSGNTPYISWTEDVNGVEKAFLGHFEGTAFKLDVNGTSRSAAGLVADLRAPVSSTCIATPFNADGSACQGGAVGSPFFLFTDGASGSQKLFGESLKPKKPKTLAASAITAAAATLNGSIDLTAGGPAAVHFEFGTTTAYGQSTAETLLAPSGARTFSATVNGLPSGTTFHFRAFARTDFGVLKGKDLTFRTN